jgi:hypothetical protein
MVGIAGPGCGDDRSEGEWGGGLDGGSDDGSGDDGGGDDGGSDDGSGDDGGGDDGGGDDGGGDDGGGDDGGDDPSSCDEPSPDDLPVPPGLVLQSEFSDAATHEVRTRGIWAIWWDRAFDHEADVDWMFTRLDDTRCRAINDLAMKDPPNPGAGFYFNVYIHHGNQDSFPGSFGNGVGTDGYGQPFMTMPNGAHLDERNILHESFHVFQWGADSPGYSWNANDTLWYAESTANWYQAWRRPTAVLSFLEAGTIDANPHLALWHSRNNEAPGDPTDWMFQVRQYGMHTWFFFMTDVAGLDQDIITAGFYDGTTFSPQEYHYQRAGADVLRSVFADWAAHNTADFDYLTPEQVQRARDEVANVGDPNNIHPYVGEYADQGTGGWVRPPAPLTPRGWSYNVVRIDNSQAATYSFTVQGDATGSAGAAAHFEGRSVVIDGSGATYGDLEMTDSVNGSASVQVTAGDTEVYLVVAAVPEHFGGNQTYGYEYAVEL